MNQEFGRSAPPTTSARGDVQPMRSTPFEQRLDAAARLALVERGVVRPEFISELLTVRLPEHPGYYGEMVWILMMLSQWLDAKAPASRF